MKAIKNKPIITPSKKTQYVAKKLTTFGILPPIISVQILPNALINAFHKLVTAGSPAIATGGWCYFTSRKVPNI
ncbi:hypothetical protein [Spiroplasma endosymbiont of Agriotes lineatus]|uniref:hypothetical protein n=1 Tax=Spiroplasma endosymbiont of Agriotes lineatus TaxID=3077930 RepID=UPI0030CD730C